MPYTYEKTSTYRNEPFDPYRKMSVRPRVWSHPYRPPYREVPVLTAAAVDLGELLHELLLVLEGGVLVDELRLDGVLLGVGGQGLLGGQVPGGQRDDDLRTQGWTSPLALNNPIVSLYNPIVS